MNIRGGLVDFTIKTFENSFYEHRLNKQHVP